MPESLDPRISMAIDLKKNRLRIHRSTLRLMGFPQFIKLLFSPEHNAIAVICCRETELPKVNEVRVTYDPRDNTHTFDIYSKDLISVIKMQLHFALPSLFSTGGLIMKRLMPVWVMILCLVCSGFAFAENESSRLDIAFGLFSVELPEGINAGPNTGNQLSDFRFETDGSIRLIYANYAPADEYESAAARKLNSLVSMVFALSGSDIARLRSRVRFSRSASLDRKRQSL